jgi:hypothetical protein
MTNTSAAVAVPYTHTGKQILANGFHYADAVDDHTAAFIVDALNAKVSSIPSTDTGKLVKALRQIAAPRETAMNPETRARWHETIAREVLSNHDAEGPGRG